MDTFESNKILNGSADLHDSREAIIRSLQEAVDYQRSRAAEILVYRFGFLRLPFVASRLDDGFNLHVWLDQLQRDPYPHTHIFDLHSRVLQAEIVDHSWKLIDDVNGKYKRVQPLYHDGITTDHELPGRVRIHPLNQRILRQDDVYSIPKGEYHSSEIPKCSKPTVTLLRRSNIEKSGHPINVMPVQQPKEQFFDLRKIAKEDAWKILSEIVDGL